MEGDRVVKVCCEDTTARHKDPRGEPYAQMSPVMLCKTARGAVIKIRIDMLSDRPHAMVNYQLQGMDGCYESCRDGSIEHGRIWLRALSKEVRWLDADSMVLFDEFAARFLPDVYRNPPEAVLRDGHGGGDFLEMGDFFRACLGKAPCPIGIHQAMDMTLPGLVSQQSVGQDGVWMGVPDSREWASANPPRPQLHMVWPPRLMGRPPAPVVPTGYVLRQYRDSEEPAYLDLMHKAGFADWSVKRMVAVKRMLLPGGFFVIEHMASGRLAATAMALHSPAELHPFGAELGWVAADPEHSGRGLGAAVCAAATARLIAAGYGDIRLQTDDWRLAAIKVYLKLGYEPLLYRDDMVPRWQAVKESLGRK